MITQYCEHHHLEIVIQELNNATDKKVYNVNMVPALVIDEKVISQGKVLSDKEIKRLLVNRVTS